MMARIPECLTSGNIYRINKTVNKIVRVFVIGFLIILVICFLPAFFLPAPEDEVLVSLGEPVSSKIYTEGVFQDFTHYGKYKFESIDIDNNEYFKQITPETEKDFLRHLEDFEGWVELIRENDPGQEVPKEYDFTTNVISEDDYLYIYDDPDYPDLGSYNVYFFDTETLTLYYFHNNI